MKADQAAIVTELDDLLTKWKAFRGTLKYGDGSDKPNESAAMMTRIAAAIDRYAPPGSSYRNYGKLHPAHVSIEILPGVLTALRDDYHDGRMKSLSELIHADLFSDFLDMAQHLLDEGYKDPAAVMAGSVLEEHLRKLADKHSVLARPSPKRGGRVAMRPMGASRRRCWGAPGRPPGTPERR